MGKYEGIYERESLGKNLTITTGAAHSRKKLVSDPKKTGPKRFELHVTKAAHIRQGDSGVEATTSDFRLPDDGYKEILVTSTKDNHISVIREEENGTCYVTEKTNKNPGSGASGPAVTFDD